MEGLAATTPVVESGIFEDLLAAGFESGISLALVSRVKLTTTSATVHIVDGRPQGDSDKSHCNPERFERKETTSKRFARALDQRDL
jgi:hypothetical protein